MQSVQPTFVAKEWVDHALGQAREPEGKLEITEKAYEEADKKLKQTLSQLTKVEKFRKNTKAALAVHEKQVAESLKAQKKARGQAQGLGLLIEYITLQSSLPLL